MLFALVGAALVFWRGLVDWLFPGFRVSRAFCWIFLLFAVVWTLIAGVVTGSQYLELTRMIGTGAFKTVEGEVRNFKPMPYGGHAQESFDVAGVSFRYSDFDLTGGGFNNTASYGGPIREGLPVRIAYSGNTILRLEVRRDAMPAQAERRETARRESEQWHRSMERMMPIIGLLVAALIITLLWNLDWRHYMHYWAPAGPPYTPRREKAFRIFVLLSLLGVSYSLIRALTTLDLSSRDYTADMLVFGTALGVFLIFDGVQRWRLRRRNGG